MDTAAYKFFVRPLTLANPILPLFLVNFPLLRISVRDTKLCTKKEPFSCISLKMAMWEDGSLLATPGDIILDCIILISIIAVFTAQAWSIHSARTSYGISPFYLLFSNLFSSTHFANTALHCAFAYPGNSYNLLPEIYHGRLSGFKAFAGLLGLMQTFMYFCGCILVYVHHRYDLLKARFMPTDRSAVCSQSASSWANPTAMQTPLRHTGATSSGRARSQP